MKNSVSLLGFGMLLLALLPAHAQILEEIVVTAQKREESLQDVGIAVTAFRGEELTIMGFEHTEDLVRLIPGVNFIALSGGRLGSFAIRGVVQSDFSDYTELPSAVYVDDGYMTNIQGQRFGLFDLERVEILRGPQGTLFGRNATGGLAHFITRKPTEEFEAYGDVQYGSYDQVRAEGAVSGPLTANVSGRLSVLYNRQNGFMKNVYPNGAQLINPLTGIPFVGAVSGAEDLGDDDTLTARGQLLWQINEDAELLVSAFASESHIGPMPLVAQALTAVIDPTTGQQVNTIFSENDPLGCEAISSVDGTCMGIILDGDFDLTRPVVGGDFFGFFDPGGIDDLDVDMDFAPDNYLKSDLRGVTAKLTWDLGAIELTSVSHYVRYDKRRTLECELSPAPTCNVTETNETDSFAQELRLNGELERARWVAGFYYLYIDNNNVGGFNYFPDSTIVLLFSLGVPFDIASFQSLETNSYSVFGQLDYDLTDKLTFIAGLRTIREDKQYEYRNQFHLNFDESRFDFGRPVSGIALFGFPAAYPPFSADTSDTLWAGRLAFEYQLNDDWLLYAGINRGVKAGGFNGKLNDFTPPQPDADIPYGEEILTAYEAGFKSTLFDGRATLNGTFFYYDYDDYQGFQFAGLGGVITNVDGKYIGAELEVVARPTDNLDLMLSGSWLDAELSNLEVATNVFRDVEPVFSPEWQLAGLARYAWRNTLFGGDVAAQMNFTYMSDRWGNIRNFDAQNMEEYVVGNARASWMSADQRWTVTFFADNINDARYITSFFDVATFTGSSEASIGKPRWFGGRIRYTWQ